MLYGALVVTVRTCYGALQIVLLLLLSFNLLIRISDAIIISVIRRRPAEFFFPAAYSAEHFWRRFLLAGIFSADKNSAANPAIGYG